MCIYKPNSLDDTPKVLPIAIAPSYKKNLEFEMNISRVVCRKTYILIDFPFENSPKGVLSFDHFLNGKFIINKIQFNYPSENSPVPWKKII